MRRVGYVVVWMLMAFSCASARANVEGFEESFDGNGPFSTERGVSISGLDNPGWGLFIDESIGTLDGKGYVFDVRAPIEPGIPAEFNQWGRELIGFGSFRETIEISNLEADWYSNGSSGDPRNAIQVIHVFGGESVYQTFNVWFDTVISPELNNKLLWRPRGDTIDLQRVPNEAMDIEFGIEYDRLTREMSYFLDSPRTGRIVSGPHLQPLPEDATTSIVWMTIASERDGRIGGRLDHWSVEPLPDIRADINDDGVLNTADIDLMSLIIRRNGTDAVADLSIDGKVDQTDLALWIHDHRKTYFGDANLDGQFNSQDLVQVYQAGRFETGQPAGWAEGDWDPNGVFDSSDLVAAFHDGGYEAGPRPATVPEPSGRNLTMIGWFLTSFLVWARRSSIRRSPPGNRSGQQDRAMSPMGRNRLIGSIALSVTLTLTQSLKAIDSFVETFDGEGSYTTTDGQFLGLDNQDWFIGGNGELRDGGYSFTVKAPRVDLSGAENVGRILSESCSFRERVELRNLSQQPILPMSPPATASEVVLTHFLDRHPGQELSVELIEFNEDGSNWAVAGVIGNTKYSQHVVPSGGNIALEIRYNKEAGKASVVYDNDIDDNSPGVTFGPYEVSDAGQSTVFYAVAGGVAKITGRLDNWTYVSLCESYADFNQSGELDVRDIDMLSAEVRADTHNFYFDLNGDLFVNDDDRAIWVHDFRTTFFGDANLDLQFDSEDLLFVFQNGEYDDKLSGNSTWATGDWSGDGEFDSRDLVLAFQDGGYETGPRQAMNSVPEPAGFALIVPGLLFAARSRRK